MTEEFILQEQGKFCNQLTIEIDYEFDTGDKEIKKWEYADPSDLVINDVKIKEGCLMDLICWLDESGESPWEAFENIICSEINGRIESSIESQIEEEEELKNRVTYYDI